MLKSEQIYIYLLKYIIHFLFNILIFTCLKEQIQFIIFQKSSSMILNQINYGGDFWQPRVYNRYTGKFR